MLGQQPAAHLLRHPAQLLRRGAAGRKNPRLSPGLSQQTDRDRAAGGQHELNGGKLLRRKALEVPQKHIRSRKQVALPQQVAGGIQRKFRALVLAHARKHGLVEQRQVVQLVSQRLRGQAVRQLHELVGVGLIGGKLLKLGAQQLDEIGLLRQWPKMAQLAAKRTENARKQNAHAALAERLARTASQPVKHIVRQTPETEHLHPKRELVPQLFEQPALHRDRELLGHQHKAGPFSLPAEKLPCQRLIAVGSGHSIHQLQQGLNAPFLLPAILSHPNASEKEKLWRFCACGAAP